METAEAIKRLLVAIILAVVGGFCGAALGFAAAWSAGIVAVLVLGDPSAGIVAIIGVGTVPIGAVLGAIAGANWKREKSVWPPT